jgi:hypothetical protein
MIRDLKYAATYFAVPNLCHCVPRPTRSNETLQPNPADGHRFIAITG